MEFKLCVYTINQLIIIQYLIRNTVFISTDFVDYCIFKLQDGGTQQRSKAAHWHRCYPGSLSISRAGTNISTGTIGNAK